MKKSNFRFKALMLSVAFSGLLLSVTEVQAKDEEQLKNGIQVGVTQEEGILNLSGMTAVEAENTITDYVDSLKEKELIFITSGGNKISTTAGTLGLSWGNPEIIEEALTLGKNGNVIQRYKLLKDLEYDKKVFVLELDADKEEILSFLNEQCTGYDVEAVNFSLIKEGDAFSVVDGRPGAVLNIESSVELVYDFLTGEWNHEETEIALDVTTLEPKGSAEELARVKDVLGTFSTSFATSSANRQGNIKVGSSKMSGMTLYPGEEFSAIEAGGPFGESNGYLQAGAFLNGRVVDSFGGGICQVTTTLYNAVLRAELDVTMRYNHSMVVSYVEPAEDAAIASSAGKDFKFVNNTEYPIYIDAYTTDEKQLVYSIYGVETRNPSRTVEYVTEILETIEPAAEKVYADDTKHLGYINVDSAHTGYKSKLWKVVKEDGVEVSRELINKSNYKMVPRTATVGVVTSDPNAYNEIVAAVGTQNIQHVKNVIAILTAPPAN